MKDFLTNVRKTAIEKKLEFMCGMHQSGITWLCFNVESDVGDWIRECARHDLYMVTIDRIDPSYRITISFGWFNKEQSEKAVLSMLRNMPTRNP